MTDFTLSPRQVLINLINANNPDETMREEDVIIGVPEAINERNRDTKIVVTARPESIWDTYQVFYYNRMDLQDDVFVRLSSQFPYTAGMSAADVIALVNERYGINLTDEDCQITDMPDGPGEVYIEAKAGSLNYQGLGLITLGSGDKIPLAVAFPNNLLDGLVYEPPVQPQV